MTEFKTFTTSTLIKINVGTFGQSLDNYFVSLAIETSNNTQITIPQGRISPQRGGGGDGGIQNRETCIKRSA